ncbi:unnamed protein product [Laminaria digitata]
MCGGVGCTPDANSTLTSADCCATEIIDSGSLCSETGAAPCIITTSAAPDDSVCDNGLTGVQDPDTDVCCPLVCGELCGGEGCGSIAGVDASQCCATNIIASGAVCSETGAPPCVVEAVTTDSNSTCSNGLSGIEDNEACCLAACGQCGGTGCGSISGLAASDCCSSTIAASGTLCSVTNAAPCMLDTPEVAPSTCPNGLAGVQDGTVCCAEACDGVCGGVGCGGIPFTNGASDCCSQTILQSGVACTDGVEAPCVMVNGTYTESPTAAPLPETTIAPTAGSRGGTFSMAPTVFGQTAAPTAGSRGIDFGTEVPTASPSTADDTETNAPTETTRDFAGGSLSPTISPEGLTLAPDSTLTPTSAASSPASAGGLVTLAAMAGGVFAIFAAARN